MVGEKYCATTLALRGNVGLCQLLAGQFDRQPVAVVLVLSIRR